MPRGQNPNSKQALKDNQKPMNSERLAKASVTKAKAKAFKEELNKELEALIRDRGGNETTTKNAMTKVLGQQALNGNLKAFELIRDTIGEKPSETVMLIQPDFTELDSLEL